MAAVRAMVGQAFALVLVVSGILLMVPAAGAQQLPPTSAPLPGSAFQGGDGNQAPALPLVDWATLQSQGLVEHSPDPTPDNAFGGGSENNAPTNWYFVNAGNGVTPGSDNILDSWASVDEAGANTFLYLAFARAAGTGTAYLAFELNRDSQLWENDRGERVPCRRDGDVLVTFQPQGNAVSLFVETWRTSTFDPDTGCARTGSLSAAGSLVANVDVQGAVNPAPITNSLPGVSPIPINQFGETALNLGTVLGAAAGRPCGAFTSVWMHSRASLSASAAMKDFVAPHAINARRCSAAGTKWLDNNANGIRDAGDIGLAGFRIYADLDDNNRYDLGEPFAITDARGDYVIDDILASGTYTLREEPTSAAPQGSWTCSHPSPCEWTVDAAAEPFAHGKDFGNWRPARVTLIKKLDPSNDPGRFDLSVGSDTLPAAGDGDRRTFTVRPGTYTVAETPVAGTSAADYESSVACSAISARTRRPRGTTSTTVTVVSGQRVVCTFVNVRRGTRSVTIDKVAPAYAVHGDTLRYELAVTNTGDVAFRADDVSVSDPRCDARPALIEQLDQTGAADSTTGSLDPGDTWIYACHRATAPLADPDVCQSDTLTNTAEVTAPGAGDEDSATTELICPPPRQPGVEIQKIGPETAAAGTALTYVLYVTNIGEVPFAEADVDVKDTACDAAPELLARYDGTGDADTSPEHLDPDDVWVYSCTNTTPDPGANCQPSVVTNTSTVIATSRRPTVQDDDSFGTQLTCPTGPPEPPVPPPPPDPPAPVIPDGVVPGRPAGPAPPAAGVAGRVSVRPLRGCLRRGSRVVVSGRRIASIRVTVRGRRVAGLRVTTLQRLAIIRIARDLRPGRHRATALIRFQRGSDTPSVRITRVVRACALARPPRVTG